MKTKRITSFVLATLVTLVLLSVLGISLAAASESTETVSSEAEFLAMKDGNYKLTKDITLSSTLPVFTGTLDGNGHTLTVSAPVFDTLSGEVKNLTVKGAITTSVTTPIGALANTVSGNLTVTDVTNETSISASKATGVGGILGSVSGTHTVALDGCTNKANVTGLADVGGFIGMVKGSSLSAHAKVTVTHSSNSGAISMTTTAKNHGVGGFLGGASFYTVEITHGVNTGAITYSGGDSGIAGFLGGSLQWNSGTTNDSFTAKYCANHGTVTVTGTNGRSGGITGRMDRAGGSLYTYEYCYNTGAITGKAASASGITGYTNTSAKLVVVGCYNIGALNSTLNCAIGTNNGNATDAYVTASNNYYIGTDESASKNIPATLCADKAALNKALLAPEDTPYLVDPDDNGGFAILKSECKHTKTSPSCVGDICDLCDEIASFKEGGSHSFGQWQTVTPATVTTNGEDTRECGVCHETETRVTAALGKITPAYGIYTVTSEDQFSWLVANLNSETLPADINVALGKDITLTKGNETVTVTFTGTVNGQSHTLSGITNTLFKQLNGTFKNCTLKGTIDDSASSNNKAASVAMNGQDVVIRNVVSYINIKTKGGNANVGGILGYGKGSVTLLDVVYAGNYEFTWTSQNAGAAGIVGWINTNNKTTAIQNCRFTGSLIVTVASTGEIDIGGIVGHAGSSGSASEVFGCVNTGTITVNQTTSETVYVGGIVGKFNDNSLSYIKNSVNSGKYTLPDTVKYGSLLGRITNKTGYLLENCAALNDSAPWCSNSENLTVSSCFNKTTVQKIGSPVTREGVSYQKYNFGYVIVDTLLPIDPSDIPTPDFGKGTIDYTGTTSCTITTPNFTSFLSSRRGKTDGTSDLRFVIAADFATLKQNKAITLTITFFDGSKELRSLTKELVKDLTVYQSALAAGITYTAGEGDVLFGIVITDVPDLAWTDVTVTLTDGELGIAAGTTDTEHFLHTAPRHFSSLKIGSTPIQDYTIVYAESPHSDLAETVATEALYPAYDFDRETAERLRDLIYLTTGKKLKVVKDTETAQTKNEILIGNTNRFTATEALALDELLSDEYLIDVEGTKLVICGGEYGTTWHAIDYLETFLKDKIKENTLTYSFAGSFAYKGEHHLKRIGCIGDSITQGTGSSNQALYAYPAQLGRLLWKDALVQNYGRSGSTMRTDLADAYTKRVAYTNAVNAAKDTDLFIIMLGTNDSNRDQNWTNASSEKYNQSCLTIVKSLKDQNADLQFVLANCPTYFGTRGFGSETVRNLQSALVKTLNDQGYPTTFFDMNSVTASMKDYFPDELHPNNTGHMLMAKAVAKSLEAFVTSDTK